MGDAIEREDAVVLLLLLALLLWMELDWLLLFCHRMTSFALALLAIALQSQAVRNYAVCQQRHVAK